MASKGYGITLSDVAMVGLLVGGVYIISKSGIFKATQGLGEGTGTVFKETGESYKAVSDLFQTGVGGIGTAYESIFDYVKSLGLKNNVTPIEISKDESKQDIASFSSAKYYGSPIVEKFEYNINEGVLTDVSTGLGYSTATPLKLSKNINKQVKSPLLTANSTPFGNKAIVNNSSSIKTSSSSSLFNKNFGKLK